MRLLEIIARVYWGRFYTLWAKSGQSALSLTPITCTPHMSEMMDIQFC